MKGVVFMKNLAYLFASLIVAVVIFLFIAGSDNSIKAETTRIMNGTLTEIKKIVP